MLHKWYIETIWSCKQGCWSLLQLSQSSVKVDDWYSTWWGGMEKRRFEETYKSSEVTGKRTEELSNARTICKHEKGWWTSDGSDEDSDELLWSRCRWQAYHRGVGGWVVGRGKSRRLRVSVWWEGYGIDEESKQDGSLVRLSCKTSWAWRSFREGGGGGEGGEVFHVWPVPT